MEETAFPLSIATWLPDLLAMPDYAFLTEPTPVEIQQITTLYRGAGWWMEKVDDPALISRIVSGSHCFVVVTARGRIVGMGRAVSDRASDAYLQDVTVDKAYRREGVGSKIVELLVERLHRDGLSWIGLVAEGNSHEFYRHLGFTKMPDAVPLLLTRS